MQLPRIAGVGGGVGTSTLAAALRARDGGIYRGGDVVDVLVARLTMYSLGRSAGDRGNARSLQSCGPCGHADIPGDSGGDHIRPEAGQPAPAGSDAAVAEVTRADNRGLEASFTMAGAAVLGRASADWLTGRIRIAYDPAGRGNMTAGSEATPRAPAALPRRRWHVHAVLGGLVV